LLAENVMIEVQVFYFLIGKYSICDNFFSSKLAFFFAVVKYCYIANYMLFIGAYCFVNSPKN